MKFPKPLILLLDLQADVASRLKDKGFNVSTGTLGRPYRVRKSANYASLLGAAKIPRRTEQEIIIADFDFIPDDQPPAEEPHRPPGEMDLLGKCDKGLHDPRARTALQLQETFQRTLQAGGAFIIFAAEKLGLKVVLGRIEHGVMMDEEPYDLDVWSTLPDLSRLEVLDLPGEEMFPSEPATPLSRCLAPYLQQGEFMCVLGNYDMRWQPLAGNKFGDTIALAKCEGTKGTIIIVPQISDKPGFLTELLTNVLPEIAPHLFPDIEQGRWTHQPDYELRSVLELQARKAALEDQFRQQVAALDQQISVERAAHGWLHELLTATDTQLVNAVITALKTVGFTQVIDMDQERDQEGKTRREDLQIRDQSPTLIIDVKGIGGYPSDDDALQANKHATIRMREQKRTDITGLSIINHQRYLPPLQRENAMPFRQELIDAAEESSLGLLTAWDLFRLVHNSQRWQWPASSVRPLFYKQGRILPIPRHYEDIGPIAKVWKGRIGVQLVDGELRLGDTIALQFEIDFEEVAVTSIQVNDQSVDRAGTGDKAGLLWPDRLPKPKEGMRVYRARNGLCGQSERV